MTTQQNTQINEQVAIIGGGPAGLATARALSQLNIPFTIFEKHSDVGGIWDRQNPGSPMYRSAHFISSKTLSGHEGFPMPEAYPDYPSNRQILNYIRDFADQYQLKNHIRFNTQVEKAEKTDSGWQVNFKTGGEDNIQQQNFRWLVCANGTNWFPNRPSFKGEENFTGDIMHAVNYQDTDQLKGKRVLVVGAGNSGVDIACDAAFSAEQAYISLRRGYHFLPKHIFGEPVDVFGSKSAWLPMWVQQRTFGLLLRLINGDLSRLGLPKPDHKVLSSHPIVNGQLLHYLQHGDISACGDIQQLNGNTVTFRDGKQVEVDLIVLATGYNWQLPYLDEAVFPWKNNRPQTFMKIFNPQQNDVFINGFVETNGGAYKLFDEMALLIAHSIETQRVNSSEAEKLQHYINGPEPQLSGSVSYVDSPRHTGYTNSDAYRAAMKQMRDHMNWPAAEEFYNAPDSGLVAAHV